MMIEIGITSCHESKSDGAFSAAENLVQPISIPPLTPKPLVSVIVANYNYGRFLPDAVQSVLDQTYPNWELIICDDGSTDDSAAILQHMGECDPRIKQLFKENGGQASAWNLAYGYARGEIICLLDADDWYRFDKLELVVRAFQADAKAGLLYHQLQPSDSSGMQIGRAYPKQLPCGWLGDVALRNGGYAFVSTTTMAIRREIAREIFPIPEQLRYYGDSYIGRVGALLTEVAAIAEPLTFYRIHGDNHSAASVVNLLNAPTLEKWVEAHVTCTHHLRVFLSRRSNSEVSDQICLSHLRGFWDMLGKLYILHGKPSAGVRGFPPMEISHNLKGSHKRVLWKIYFGLPHPLSLWLLRVQVYCVAFAKSIWWYVNAHAE